MSVVSRLREKAKEEEVAIVARSQLSQDRNCRNCHKVAIVTGSQLSQDRNCRNCHRVAIVAGLQRSQDYKKGRLWKNKYKIEEQRFLI